MGFHIHGFEFDRDSGHFLSDTTKITARSTQVRLARSLRDPQLETRSAYVFPLGTTTPFYVRTKLFSPEAYKGWLHVELRGETPQDVDLGLGTAFALRIHDGTNPRFWDGAAWSVAADSDWNTLTTFNANLPSLIKTSIAVEVRLSTTADDLTPVLRAVLLAWEAAPFDPIDDYIQNGVVRDLRANVRPTNRWVFTADGTASLDISGMDMNVDNVTAVYDHTVDSGHATNLFSSFTPPSTVALSASPPIGNKLYVEFSYVPIISITTAAQYAESSAGSRTLHIAKAPSLWITRVSENRIPGGVRRLGGRGEACIDRSLSPPLGVVYLTPPRHVHVVFDISLISRNSYEHTRLVSAVRGWIESAHDLRLPARDVLVSLILEDGLDWSTISGDVEDTKVASLGFRLLDLPIYDATYGQGIKAPDSNYPGIGYAVTALNLVFNGEEHLVEP